MSNQPYSANGLTFHSLGGGSGSGFGSERVSTNGSSFSGLWSGGVEDLVFHIGKLTMPKVLPFNLMSLKPTISRFVTSFFYVAMLGHMKA